MAIIIAVTNQKGGVGKTTSCINIAASFAFVKKKILLVDFDPQGNATMGSGINKNDVDLTITDLLITDENEASVEDINSAIKTTKAGFDLIPANRDLTGAEIQLLELPNKENILKNILCKVAHKYEYIVIDCPPSLNMLTVNALVAANSVLIPIQCEYYALEGLASLIQTIEGIKKMVNKDLKIEGLLRTMCDPRNKLTNEVSAQLIECFGDKVFNTSIPRNVRLAEAPSHGLTILEYDRYSRGAAAYLALVGEILRRHRQKVTDVEVEADEDRIKESKQLEQIAV